MIIFCRWPLLLSQMSLAPMEEKHQLLLHHQLLPQVIMFLHKKFSPLSTRFSSLLLVVNYLIIVKRKVDTVMGTITFHHCGLGLILNMMLYVDWGLFAYPLCPKRFFAGPTDFPSCQKNQHFIGLIWLELVWSQPNNSETYCFFGIFFSTQVACLSFV